MEISEYEQPAQDHLLRRQQHSLQEWRRRWDSHHAQTLDNKAPSWWDKIRDKMRDE